MIAQANVATTIEPIYLEDASGTPVTTKTNGDFATFAMLDGTETALTVTITHVSSGLYKRQATFPTVGTWTIVSVVYIDGEYIPDITTVQVLTAAQIDPAAALGDPFARAATGYEAGTLGAKVARIGTTGVGVTNPSTTTATTMTIRRGDDYTLGSPRGPFEWTEDTWESYGLTDDGVVITWALTGTTTTKAMSAVDSTTVRLELTDTETALLPYGIIPFTVKAAIGADTITLIAGTATIT